jgi:hypothetical protein
MHSGHSVPESKSDHDERQKSSENERMRESSVPPEVPVPDSKTKPNHIEVWDDRTRCPDHPNTLWNLRLVEASSNAEGCYHMRWQ